MGYDAFGERRLMLAVLEDAIRTLLLARRTAVPPKRLLRELAWLESTSLTEPFAFESICDALGLEPDWIRGLLRRWVSTEAAPARRPVKIASVRRIAGSRHTVTGRAPGLRHVTRFAC